MPPSPRPDTRFTLDDFMLFPDDGKRHEIVIFSFHDVVEPDLLVITADQLDILTDKNVQGAPALVVEIQSPTTRRRDQTLKHRLFDRGGVREYWLVDPDRNRVRVFRRSSEGSFPMALEPSLDSGGVLTTPVLPGFVVDVAVIFAD
ncbi:MAG: Uma2 family endonuclease [Acidobacteriota bacterium]|nr:Uma2 family endonuclease [Acidobacteriota bacterium]